MRAFILAAGLAPLGVAHAGHEFPFYPSFYPQEITVEALDARAAAQRLAKGTLHAYAGAEIAAPPAKTGSVASLGAYVVATSGRDGCAAARGMQDALGEGAVWHPYPVTPFHADYLHHADRAAAARAATAVQNKKWAGKVEIVDVGALMARASVRYNGWSGPPWLRQGWFHAYLLLAPAAADARIENAARRLMRGEHRSLEERINLERSLVEMLQARCERVVLGYTVRREHYGVEYSAGVENVGYDALEGLAAAIFPRTVKLRDFPWNSTSPRRRRPPARGILWSADSATLSAASCGRRLPIPRSCPRRTAAAGSRTASAPAPKRVRHRSWSPRTRSLRPDAAGRPPCASSTACAIRASTTAPR
jgi:hypothetical protein